MKSHLRFSKLSFEPHPFGRTCCGALFLLISSCTPLTLQLEPTKGSIVTTKSGSAVTQPAAEPADASDTNERQDDGQVSTPVLIQRAWERDEISEGEKVLYLAYAVYDYESLPAEFRSDVGWHGTRAVKEIYEAISTQKLCEFEESVQDELHRLKPEQAINCEE